ncbi:MAG: TIGR03668 family PPOX class F420-dependent oxidoreductase [Chloroflexi bacterium]|nr:TIGR03668 family PPOX class F420-dependent oxidoreductase [Chloroflexota bacterium]|tara:strand:- start:1368 stop:1826 length:459 start_codon:yes stop_codon:yes gene_type:complete
MPYRLLMQTALDKDALQWLSSQKVAYLATTDVHAQAHIVPVVFVLIDQNIFICIDGKPKKSRSLKRLTNIKANPKISLLVDNYDDDWQQLKWVRVDGTAIVLESTDESRAVFESVISTLRDKYPQYQTMDLSRGPLISITINAIASWQAYRK